MSYLGMEEEQQLYTTYVNCKGVCDRLMEEILHIYNVYYKFIFNERSDIVYFDCQNKNEADEPEKYPHDDNLQA